jgi:hypothetical protein
MELSEYIYLEDGSYIARRLVARISKISDQNQYLEKCLLLNEEGLELGVAFLTSVFEKKAELVQTSGWVAWKLEFDPYELSKPFVRTSYPIVAWRTCGILNGGIDLFGSTHTVQNNTRICQAELKYFENYQHPSTPYWIEINDAVFSFSCMHELDKKLAMTAAEIADRIRKGRKPIPR